MAGNVDDTREPTAPARDPDDEWVPTGLPPVDVRRPRAKALDERQATYILARNHIARVAFLADGRIELQPIHYVYADGSLFGRTSMGRKYLTWLVESEVVVEVDECESPFDWRSVVVRGSVTLLRSRGSTEERALYERAIGLLRRLVPDALTERDPAPQREFVFRVIPVEMTARESSSRRV